MAKDQHVNTNPYKAPGPSFNESRGFIGLDNFTNPQDMDGGHLIGCQNFINRAGILYVRPGLLGLYGATTAPSSQGPSSSSSSSSLQYNDVGNTYYSVPLGPLYPISTMTDPTGNTWIIKSAGGRIFKTLQGSGNYTELFDVNGHAYNIDSANTYGIVFENYTYLVDGSQNYIKRLNLSGGYPAYPMQASKQSPAVGLTQGLLFQANSAANWSFDGQATAYTNAFASFGLIHQPGNTWQQTDPNGQTPNLPGTPGDWVNMIAPGAILTPGAPNAFIAIPALSGNSALYPSRFHVLMNVNVDSPGVGYGVNVSMTPFDASHNQLASAIVFNCQPTVAAPLLFDHIFDWSGLGPSVAFVQFSVTKAQDHDSGNLYVETPQLFPMSVQTAIVGGTTATTFYPTESGGAIAASSSSSSPSSSSSSSLNSSYIGPITNKPATDLGNVLDYQGTSFIFKFPTDSSSSSMSVGISSSSSSSSIVPEILGVNLSNVDRLVITCGTGQIASWVGALFKLYLQDGFGNWMLATNGVRISDDLTGIDCDISTLTAAQLSNVCGIKLTFQANVTWAAPFYALPLGPINNPGNLSVGLGDYTYYLTEKAVIDSANSIEGNPGLSSLALRPVFAQAEALINLASDMPVNTSAPASVPSSQLWYDLYRLGGAWGDVRQIATVNSSVSVAYGTDKANPYYSWDAVNKVFLDNTPDGFLALANLMSFSRDPMPIGISTLGVWEGRLCGAVKNQLYLSWLYNTNNSAPLTTTLILNESDPNAPIFGANFPISEDASDTIIALVPFGTPVLAGEQFGGGLLVLCKRSVWMVQGTNAENFSLQQYPYSVGVGLIAPRGYARISPNELVFMGPDRLHIFPPDLDSPERDLGLRIQPQLYPSSPQVLQNQTAFSKSWMLYHDARLYLGCPTPGNNQNNIVWIYDYRTQGWTSYTGPTVNGGSSSSSSLAPGSSSSSSYNWSGGFTEPGMATTSALSLPPNASGANFELYFFGLDGQLYQNNGTYDQASPIAAKQAIPFLLTFHALRPGFFYRFRLHPLLYMWARLEWVLIEMMMNGPLTITAQAFMAGQLNPTPLANTLVVQRYNLAGGGRPFTMNMPGGLVEGQLIEVSISGSVGLQGTVNNPDIAYCRGVRGLCSGTTYERA